MKKIKLIEKGSYTAKGVLDDGTELYFSKRNTSWYEHNIAGRNVGDEFNVVVKTSTTTGRQYVDRVTGDVAKEMNELEISMNNLQSSIKRNQLLDKQLLIL